MLRKLWLFGQGWKRTLLAGIKNWPHSADNLKALQHLANRRFDPENFPRKISYTASVAWPMIDVSVVTHNSCEWAASFLSSLCAQDYPLDRISLFVIDNESEDNTLETIKKELARLKAGFAAVHLIAQSNLGFGVGHDRAIRSGGAAYCLVTNIDLEFRSDSLTTTVSTALDDQHGQVASWELRQIPYEHPKHYDPVTLETNWSSHACILLRRSAYETVGGYDPQIFMYTEDVELSYRFRSYGYVLRYVPNAVVHHYTYKSSGEVKPIQFFNSILGNIYLRIRYGGWKDLLTGFVLFAGMLFLPEPFPKAI